MKSIFKRLSLLAVPFMVIGCTPKEGSVTPSIEPSSSSPAESSSSKETSVPASSSSKISSSALPQYEAKLPQIRVTFSKTDPNANFATVATKSDLTRPEVDGKISITNVGDSYAKTDVPCTFKVRGNQTANWSKKAFRIKLSNKANLLGLNGGKKFKKWVLLADAKDTTLIRSAAGFYLARSVIQEGDKVWTSDYTPVTVYLNDEYWGMYYLAEQKEVKEGRVQLEEAEGNTSIEIGYCFELDHYADSAGSPDEASEIRKGAEGDPTFRMKYAPEMVQGRPQGPLATGQVNTYTMLSDISDGPTNEHVQADYTNVQNNGQLSQNSVKTSNSAQLSFIRARMEASYTVLYQAAMKNKAYEINDQNEAVISTKSVQEVMNQHFNLNAWADGYIINGFSVPPDLGYSSFYMSYDNTPTGDHKLRYDVPWDFDSNFGNRNNFYVNADGDEYVNNTYNTWLFLLSKLSFFKDIVKTKWNKLRDDKVFEGMFDMMKTFWKDNDGEIRKNHEKWPQNDAAHQPPNNFDEIRNPYKDPAQYKEAEAETLSWCVKRVNYLEKQWGKNRANITASL